MSRTVRMVVLVALFGWTLTEVPDRVQAQRAAVAELAAERGAASAGGALLARIADLRNVDTDTPDVWRVTPAAPCPGPVDTLLSYDGAVEAVRRRRACEAVRFVAPALAAAQLVQVDGDAFLVLPGIIGRHTSVETTETTETPGTSEATEAGATETTGTTTTTTTTRDREITVSGLPITVKVTVERDGELIEARTVSGDATVAVPTDLAGWKKLAEARTIADLIRIEQLDVREVSGTHPPPPGALPPEAARLRDAFETLHDLGALAPDAFDAVVAARPDGDPSLYIAAATVAWWPPIQADIEARTGIPLQVGGEPPRARAILPGHRLAGAPVWSLPTPETEATIDLFDGGSLLWLFALTGLFGRELFAWRRSVAYANDRQTARDSILQRLSHELRTPAASVRSLVDALALPGTSEAEREQFRDLARSEAERLATGIDRLLQAARGDAELGIDPVPLDLAAWAEAVRARWSPRLPGLLVQAANPSPAVADPERLDEAVDALLDNARKYGGPNVTLTVGPNRIVVDDDGEGIPAGDRARVTQKFERMEGRVNDPGGHGLGLWAVAEVARAHGGKLAIDGPSRFVVTLVGKGTK